MSVSYEIGPILEELKWGGSGGWGGGVKLIEKRNNPSARQNEAFLCNE